MSSSAGRLTGTVTLITGAASGIGAAIARRIVSEGGKVVCTDRDESAALSLADEIGASALALACDVTDASSAQHAVRMTQQRFGRLDGLVHNAAALFIDGTVVDLDEKQWRLEIDVSLTGAFLVSKFAVPLIGESGGGSVVFVASQFGHVAVAKSPAYCAAKAGLINLAKAMAIDHAPQGVRVNSLSPGAVWTARLMQRWPDLDAANAGLGPAHLLGRIGKPEEIAAAAAFLLSADSSFMTGSDLLVDGGYAAH